MNVDGCLALFSRSVCLIAAHVTPRQTHPASVMYVHTLCAPYPNAVRESRSAISFSLTLFVAARKCGGVKLL